VLLFVAVGLPILILFLFGEPYKRGFFCDDESIKYPYKDSTVSNTVLYIVGLGVTVLIVRLFQMLLVELMHWWRGDENGHTFKLCGKHIPLWLSNSYKVIGVFGFGAVCSQLLTDIGKYSIGRLRPHFMDICSPNISCDMPENQHKYIETFTCNGGDEKLLRDARLSFPSGHSSFSAYTMLYLVIYLQCRLNWKGSYLLRHVVQFCCLAMVWGTALSRVSNYKHHWSDVTAGLIIGIVVAIVNVSFIYLQTFLSINCPF
ncbi:hypothetical protein AAG570_013327, partial [Ranatra chinensis]